MFSDLLYESKREASHFLNFSSIRLQTYAKNQDSFAESLTLRIVNVWQILYHLCPGLLSVSTGF